MSIVGAISTSHILKAATTTGPYDSTPSIEDFRVLIGARRCHFLAVEKTLDEAGTAAAQPYIALGYRPVGVSSFWLAGSDTALLPLQLKHSAEGILDTQVLVFSRLSTGTWQPAGSLSGFHLEAIAKMLPELQPRHLDADAMRKLVLPVNGKGRLVSNGWAHFTESGDFKLSVQITTGQTMVEAAIVQAGKTIWQKVFHSSHALQCAPGLLT